MEGLMVLNALEKLKNITLTCPLDMANVGVGPMEQVEESVLHSNAVPLGKLMGVHDIVHEPTLHWAFD